MANTAEVRLVITADGTAAIASIDKVAHSLESLSGRATVLSAKFGIIAHAISKAWDIINQGWDIAEHAAREREMHDILNRLASAYDTTAKEIVHDIQVASSGLISVTDIMQTSLNALAKGLTPKQLQELASASATLADITGTTTAQAFDTLASAIALGRERAIETRVGVIDLSQAYGEQAGKLSETEKVALRYTLAMESIHRIQAQIGDSTSSIADRMERVRATMANVSSWLKEQFLKLALAVTGFVKLAISGFDHLGTLYFRFAQAIGWITDKLGITTNAEEYWRKQVQANTAAVKGLVDSAMKDFEAILNTTTEATGVNTKALLGQHKVLKNIENTTKDLTKANKELENATKELTESLMTEEEKIAHKYEIYQQLGVNRVLLEQWVSNEIQKLAEKDFQAWEAEHHHRLEAQREVTEQELELEKKAQEERLRQYQEYMQREIEAQQAFIKLWLDNYEYAWSELFRMANEIGGEMGRAIGEMMANLKGITDIEAGVDPYTREYERIAQHYADIIQLKIERYGAEAEIEAEWQAIMLAQEEAAQQRRLAMARYTFGAMASAMYSYYEASGRQSKTAFAAYKAFAIAQTIIDTYQSAQAAFKAMAGIPYVGPILGAIAAAAAIAAGMARVQAIKSQTIGGSSSVPPSSGGGYQHIAPNEPMWQRQEEEKPVATPVVNVYVYGSIVDHAQFAREVLPAIQQAQSDGVR